MKIDGKTAGYSGDERQPFYEMACVSKEDTGLPYDLWIDSLGKDRNVGKVQIPQVMVQIGDELISVCLSKDLSKNCVDSPKGLNAVREYIKAYSRVFLAHYDRLITDRQALMLLLRIEEADSELVNRVLQEAGAIQG